MPARSALPSMLLVALLLATVGCRQETRVVRGGWGDWARQVGAEVSEGNTTAERGDAEGHTPARSDDVTIFLARLDGGTRHRKAKELVKLVRTLADREDAWSTDDGKTTTVYVGRYGPAGQGVALQDAEALRAVVQGEQRPFADAEVINLGVQDLPLHPHDLRRHMGSFSLQIGFYDEGFGGDFRKACETAVAVLRQDGTPAYFYHGPFRSLLCVGVFTDADFDDTTGVRSYGPAIRQWRDKYPYNLANGITMIEKTRGGENLGAQPSFLVRVF